MFPSEHDSLRIDDDQLARNESWVLKFQFGDLAFATQGSQVRAPGDCASGYKIVSGDLHRLDVILVLHDFDDFVKVPRIMSDPLAFQI